MNGYVLGVDAELDLQEIWAYIADDDLDAADRWIATLFETFDLLARTPGMGRSREDLTYLPVLFWPVGQYIVVYRLKPDCIQIVGITQGSRDIPSFLARRSR